MEKNICAGAGAHVTQGDHVWHAHPEPPERAVVAL